MIFEKECIYVFVVNILVFFKIVRRLRLLVEYYNLDLGYLIDGFFFYISFYYKLLIISIC